MAETRDDFEIPEEWVYARPYLQDKWTERRKHVDRRNAEIDLKLSTLERAVTAQTQAALAELSVHVDARFDELKFESTKLLDEYTNALTLSNLERAGVRDALNQVSGHQVRASHLMALQLMLTFVLAGVVSYLAWVPK